MRRIDIGVVLPLALLAVVIIVTLFFGAARPEHQVEFQMVTGRALPLIVISNGGGEPLAGRADTALALAASGFVAAVVTHTDDETMDQRYVAMPRWLTDRPREIHLTLQYMLNDWPAHRQLDATRVGMFGYSNGGYTALVSIGGVPNSAQLALRPPQAVAYSSPTDCRG